MKSCTKYIVSKFPKFLAKWIHNNTQVCKLTYGLDNEGNQVLNESKKMFYHILHTILYEKPCCCVHLSMVYLMYSNFETKIYILIEAGYSLYLLANLEIVTKILALPSKLIDIRHPLPSHNGKFFTLSSAILESWAAVSLLRNRTFMLDEMFSWIWHISLNFLLISLLMNLLGKKLSGTK